MRLALLSDIHGNLAALEAVVADLRMRAVDRIVNLGDCLSGPLLPRETARILMAAGWTTLAGNHERQLLDDAPRGRGASDAYAHAQLGPEEFAWLRALPPTVRLAGTRDASEVLLCHGSPTSDVQYLLETIDAGRRDAVPDADATREPVRAATADEIDARLGGETASLVACGHTHVPRCVRTARGQLVVNPGSVGMPAYDDVHPVPHVVETGSPDARYAIVESLPDGAWRVELVALPYDHRPMARLAARNGRPDWEHALLTGRVA